jgi:hypothetical protein
MSKNRLDLRDRPMPGFGNLFLRSGLENGHGLLLSRRFARAFPDGGPDRIRTCDPALIKRML